MKFKDWLQNEIDLNLNKAAVSSNPTQAAQATQGVAKNAMAKFGPNLVKDLGAAPNTLKAGEVAVNYAKKALGSTQPEKSSTNALAVGANVYRQATGKDLKMMGKK